MAPFKYGLRESMWDSAKVCVYNLLQSFSASKLSWYTVYLLRLLHLFCLTSLLYQYTNFFAWLVFCNYLVYLPMAIATYFFVCLLLSCLCLPCSLCLLFTVLATYSGLGFYAYIRYSSRLS